MKFPGCVFVWRAETGGEEMARAIRGNPEAGWCKDTFTLHPAKVLFLEPNPFPSSKDGGLKAAAKSKKLSRRFTRSGHEKLGKVTGD